MIKTSLTAVLLIFHFSPIYTQTQLPNADLEHWTLAANGTDSLIGWSSSNAVVIPPVISLYQEKDAWQGNLAAHVVTAPFGFVGYSTVGVLVNGEATFSYGGGGGGANVDHATGGGSPISMKPNALTGYYRTTTLSPGDQPLARILLSRASPSGKRDTVGYASYTFPTSADYIPFSIPIPDWMPGVQPDSITTIFYSSHPTDVDPIGVWSDLYLDSLTLIYPTTAIEEPTPSRPMLTCIPNPCSNSTRVTWTGGHVVQLAISDSQGNIQECTKLTGQHQIELDTHTWPAGTYFLILDGPAGPCTGMLTVIHD